MCLLSPLPWLLPLTSPFTLTLSPSPLVLSAGSPSFRAGPGPSPPSGMAPSIVGEGALSFAMGGTSSGEGDFHRINWRRLRVGVQKSSKTKCVYYKYHMHANFCWTKITPSPATFMLQKLKFFQCGKGYHILCAIVNRGCKIKFHQWEQVVKLVKISTHMNTLTTCTDAWHTQ